MQTMLIRVTKECNVNGVSAAVGEKHEVSKKDGTALIDQGLAVALSESKDEDEHETKTKSGGH